MLNPTLSCSDGLGDSLRGLGLAKYGRAFRANNIGMLAAIAAAEHMWTNDIHDTQLRSGICSSSGGLVMMKMLALAGTICIAISAQAQATPSIPSGKPSVRTVVVPIQPRPVPSCNKGYHYGFCTNPRTGRRYRGCCPNWIQSAN